MFLPLRMIPVPVQCVILSTVFELYLATHRELQDHLDALEGRCCRILVRDSGVVIFLLFIDGKIRVRAEFEGAVDVYVTSTMSGFARLCFGSEDADDLVFKQVLKLSGDSETMLRFKKMLATTDLDWEMGLRQAFGDFFGDKVVRFARGLIAAEQRATQGAEQWINSSLHQMGAPDEAQLQRWQSQVEALSRKLPPLKGRVTKLEHRLQALDRS
ncbi:MAG: SCP2 sterol-binding domain-containing protein [Mariprofundales bacterium]|nr:SCP2 sterol-binding domain-containing protein [Mariprofundales bacterium]